MFHTLILQCSDWLDVEDQKKKPNKRNVRIIRMLFFVMLRLVLQLRIMQYVEWPWAVVLLIAFCDLWLWFLRYFTDDWLGLLSSKWNYVHRRTIGVTIAQICISAVGVFGVATMLLWTSVCAGEYAYVHVWRWAVVATTLLHSVVILCTDIKWNGFLMLSVCMGANVTITFIIWYLFASHTVFSVPIAFLVLYILYVVSVRFVYYTTTCSPAFHWVGILLAMCCISPLITEDVVINITWLFSITFTPMLFGLYRYVTDLRLVPVSNVFLAQFPADPLIPGHLFGGKAELAPFCFLARS